MMGVSYLISGPIKGQNRKLARIILTDGLFAASGGELSTFPHVVMKVARVIADAANTTVYLEREGVKDNPTLVHHGIAQGASYHLLSKHGAPFADLYFGNRETAQRVAQLIADIFRTPLMLAPNDEAGRRGQLSKAESFKRYPLSQAGGPVDAIQPAPIGNPRPAKRLKWNMYAGGTGAWEGAHAYDARTPWGQYTVDPVTTQYGRRAGYVVRFNIGGPGLLPLPAHMYQAGLYRDLGRERSPNAAKRVAQSHHEAVMMGSDTAQSNPAGPVVGQLWGRHSGGTSRVLALRGSRIQVLNMHSGVREWLMLSDFLATHRPPGRRNPDPGGPLSRSRFVAGLNRALKELGHKRISEAERRWAMSVTGSGDTAQLEDLAYRIAKTREAEGGDWQRKARGRRGRSNPNPHRGAVGTFVRTGERVRVKGKGDHYGEHGTVLVGGGVALVRLDSGTQTWFNADRLSGSRAKKPATNPRKTLREWSEQYGIDMRSKGGAMWIPDQFVNESTRRELWNLSDYLVSSVTGGTIWLIPRKAGTHDTNPRRTPSAGPMGYREAVRWLGQDHVDYIVGAGARDVLNRRAGAWTANMLDSMEAYDAIMRHHFPAEWKAAKGPESNPRELSVPEKHLLNIARKTLKMNETMARVMGGVTSHAEAREIIHRLTGKWPKEPNPARRGYLITENKIRDEFYVSRDGHHIATAPNLKAAEKIVDELAGPRSNPRGHGFFIVYADNGAVIWRGAATSIKNALTLARAEVKHGPLGPPKPWHAYRDDSMGGPPLDKRYSSNPRGGFWSEVDAELASRGMDPVTGDEAEALEQAGWGKGKKNVPGNAAFALMMRRGQGLAGGPRRNPRPFSDELERARDTFRMWHEFDADKLERVPVPSRQVPKHLVNLGEIVRIDYKSNKWEGRPVTYTHSTKRPRPKLVTDPDARQLFIVGGKMRPTADGLIN